MDPEGRLRGTAAGMALQGWCCRDAAAGMVLQGWCCRDGAAEMVLHGWCCRDGAAGMVLQGWHCLDNAAWTASHGPLYTVKTDKFLFKAPSQTRRRELKAQINQDRSAFSSSAQHIDLCKDAAPIAQGRRRH